jgi:PAS domain S-box-containing protein
MEFRAIGADGVERVLWVYGAIETDADGRVIRTVGTTLDVTVRKRIEQALEESEARLRGLFDYAPVGIGLADPEGNLVEVNQQFADFLGYTTEEILELSYRDYTHPDHLEVSEQQLEALLAGDIARASQEKLYIRRDGATVWVNRTVSLIRDEAGAPRFVVVIVEDIDDRKRTEKELALATEQLEEAQRIGHIGHWEWRSGSTDTVWSDEMYRIFGMEPGAIHPTHDSFFGMVHEDDRESIAAMMAETIESGRTYETEFRIIRADGAMRHVFERGERYIDEKTGEWSVRGIMQDITERKAFEEKLRETAASLEKSQRIARLGSWIWDAKEDKEWWSDEIYRMFGMDVGLVGGRGWVRLSGLRAPGRPGARPRNR